MKKLILLSLLFSFVVIAFESCQESGAKSLQPRPEEGMVRGIATDGQGHPLKNVLVELSHTVWSDKHLKALTDESGHYSITLPAEPRGNWTIKATYDKSAYGEDYQFVLDANDNSSFGGVRGAIRNFTWKLVGEHIGGEYGAQVNVQSLGKKVPLKEVKLIFSPIEEYLVDGSEAKSLEKTLDKVNDQYRASAIPLGKYAVQAVYQGTVLKVATAPTAGRFAESAAVIFVPADPASAAAYEGQLYIQP